MQLLGNKLVFIEADLCSGGQLKQLGYLPDGYLRRRRGGQVQHSLAITVQLHSVDLFHNCLCL